MTKTKNFVSPFTSTFDVNEIMNDIFQEVFNPAFSERYKVGLDKHVYPKTDIIDEESSILFEVDIHGLKKEDISVEIEPSESRKISYLHVTGNKKPTTTDTERKYIKREIKRSSWKRSWTLSEEKYNVDQIEVEVTDGILSVRVPKICDDTSERKIKKLL